MKDQEIREALLERDFTRAESLTLEWGKSVRQQAEAAINTTERRRILAEAQQQGEQNLYLAQVVRANISSELHSNSASFLYRDTDLEQPRWRVRA